MAPFILIDGSSYFFRAFHALPPLTNSKGLPTGAVYGVVNMVKRLIKDMQPEYLVVVFDAKGKTFRNDMYSDYKAHRPATPSELTVQFDPLNAVLKAMGLPILIIDNVEADDVIGTLALSAAQAGHPVLISSSDKDMAQLVTENVTMVNTMTSTTLDIAGVKAKFGVYPHQIIDYLTLIGDSIDNIPGVDKCGPKTAAKWLEQYSTLDELIVNAASITGKIGENLRASLAHLPLSKQLITIKTDVEIPFTLDELKIKPADNITLLRLTQDLEFKNWAKELTQHDDNISEKEQSQEPSLQKPVLLIQEEAALLQCVEQLQSCDHFSLSIQSNHLEPMMGDIIGVSLVIDENNLFYIPLVHSDNSSFLTKQHVLKTLKPVLENSNIRKIGYNLKHDYQLLKAHDITLEAVYFDVMLASYVVNSTASQHNLDSLALKYLNQSIINSDDVQGKGAKYQSLDKLSATIAADFAANNALIVLKLYQVLDALLEHALRDVFYSIEMPLLIVLAEMERLGVSIDKETLLKHGKRLKIRIKELEEEAFALAGKPFNLNSPKQLQVIFYDELKLPILAKTPKGQPSTAESVLQELSFDYKLPALILEYRGLSKLISTYIDALPKRINGHTSRVHTCYNQAVAATGRLSSSEPNLQNIPIRTEEGRLIRTAFVAPPNHVLLAADYSQIELRIMAHLSADENLLKAFANGWDIHTATASEIFQVPLDEVTHEQRRRAKAVNFGLIYGMSAFGLAKQLGITRQDAEFYMERYFTRYPGVHTYMESTRQQAHKQGYVETIFGRRLYLPEISARNIMRRKAAERMAINAPMQGTAADIIKKAMIVIADWQTTLTDQPIKMIMQVHDELLFEVATDHVDELKEQIKHKMEHAVTLAVPLEVVIGSGANWDEAH